MENTVYAMFRRQAEMQPEAPAIVTDTQTLSFADLDQLADRVTALFPEKAPKRVGVVCLHGPELIATLLAVLKSGAAYVPAEPSFPAGRISYMMKNAGVDFVITSRACSDRIDGDLTQVTIEDLEAVKPSDLDVPDSSTPEGEAYVLYTSGTTGRPKGVLISNRNVCHYARAFEKEFHIGPGDVMLQYSVCSFDIFVEEVFAALLNGAAIAIPNDSVRNDPVRLEHFIDAHHVTLISGFPYLIRDMSVSGFPKSVRLLISGGDVLRADYTKGVPEGIVLYNTYGPSEATVCASYQRCDNIPPLADGTYPIGHPVEGTEITIVDDRLQPVADGECGQIMISGDGVGLGYVGNPPESANYITLPDGRAAYLSGDLGYRLPDGSFVFLRRKDDQVMILGKRVEPKEVENLLHQVDGVKDAVVFSDTDPENLSYMTAYVVPEPGRELTATELRKTLGENLADFMIPEFFILMPEIPLNANGKPDRGRFPKVLK